MGVTHKLNPEVLNFILQQKKDNPGLGCRKLAELVSLHFQINVSKSSVNNVLKESNLSNSVGRPSKKAKEKMKKFQIPSDKKQQISDALHKIPIPDNVQSELAESTQAAGTTPEASQEQENSTITAEVPAGAAEDREWGETVTMQHAGGMFLLAAFYETMDETVLGSLLSDYSQQADRKQFERKCNAALLMSNLNIGDPAERDFILREQAEFDFSIDELQNLVAQETSDVDRILLQTKIDLELSQLSNRSSGYTVTLEGGQSIKLSPFLEIRRSGDAAASGAPFPMKAAVGKLSEEILVNNQPYLFCLEQDADLADAVNLMAAFEQENGCKISNINILGESGDPQLDFSYITDKRRQFIFGVFPGDPAFDKFIRSSQWPVRENFLDKEEKSWEYAVTRTDYKSTHMSGFSAELYAITVWEESGADPVMALVTNVIDDQKLLLERHLSYFADVVGRRAGRTAAGFVGGAPEEGQTSIPEYPQLRDVFTRFGDFLISHARNEYFGGGVDAESAKNLLSMSGSVTLGKAVVEVQLTPEKGGDETSQNWLRKAVENVNTRKIYDGSHRILRFYVK